MALTIPPKFLNDIQGRDTALIPVVEIPDLHFMLDGEEVPRYISTNVNIGGSNSALPILLNIPSLKESIDLDTRKYKISSVSIDLSNYKYQGVRFSDLVGDSSLINAECKIYWVSPSTSINDEAFFVYSGTIRRYDHDTEKVRLVVEDRSQATLHKDLPLTNLGTDDEVPDKYKNKPIPMVYGTVNRSPCVFKITEQVT